jgi:hypothetical protein
MEVDDGFLVDLPWFDEHFPAGLSMKYAVDVLHTLKAFQHD